jgi:hypothetical protein
MTAALLFEVRAAGFSLSRVGEDRIAWEFEGDPPPGLLNRIRAAKSVLLAALKMEEAERWQIENPLPARSFAEGCAHCLAPVALENAVPVLAGRYDGGHAWVHRSCWRPLREARQREAREALEVWRR